MSVFQLNRLCSAFHWQALLNPALLGLLRRIQLVRQTHTEW